MVDDPPETGTANVISVSAFNRMARQVIENNLSLMWIAGEVSNLTHAGSGHVYFTLKDERAAVRCVMFRSRAMLMAFRLVAGAHVEVRGLGTLYEPRGDFQLVAESIRQAGIGALYEAWARLRARLGAEGLFDPERKRPLPRLPRRIGLISSLHAAAVHDVLSTLERRCPHVPVHIYPSAVQGAEAPAALIDALRRAGAGAECDLLIVARGGGSIEDLWAFNDEALVRAIAACPLPVVCGVGHETDVTLADLVADQRAATPTAAAELASAGWVEAGALLTRLASRLNGAARHSLDALMQRVDLIARRVIPPAERLARLRLEARHLGMRMTSAVETGRLRRRHEVSHMALRAAAVRPDSVRHRLQVEHWSQRMTAAFDRERQRRHDRVSELAAHLAYLDPAAPLARGYALVRDAQGRVVRDAATLHAGDSLRLQFARGWAQATVERKGD